MSVIKESGIYEDQYGFLYYYMEDELTNSAPDDHIFYEKKKGRYVTIYEEVIDLFNYGDISFTPKKIIVNTRRIKWHSI
jgi:hypothetical protein